MAKNEGKMKRSRPEWVGIFTSAASIVIFLWALLWLTVAIQHPLVWLAVVAGLIVYAIGDGVTDLVKWVVRLGPLKRASLLFELLAIILLVVVGLAYNDDIQKLTQQVVLGTVLNSNFGLGGPPTVIALTFIIPVVFVLYITLRSDEFRKWRANTPISVMVSASPDGEMVIQNVRTVAEAFSRKKASEIMNACNRVRLEYLTKWKGESGETVEGTNISRSIAIREAEPPFQLWKSKGIVLQVLDPGTDSVGGLRAPQVTITNVESRTSVIYTLLKWVKKDGAETYIVDPETGASLMTLMDSTIHELLHAAGDLEPGRKDGVVRQTWIGVRAVKPLLGLA